MKRFLPVLLSLSLLAGCAPKSAQTPSPGWKPFAVPAAEVLAEKPFGASVGYAGTSVEISPALGADFSLDEIPNLSAMAEAYGITLTAADEAFLRQKKFLMKSLPDTAIRPTMGRPGFSDRYREFLALYNTVHGSNDVKAREQSNAVYLSSDLFFHSYNLLYTELLKEMENTVFAPAVKQLSKIFFEEAGKKADAATGAEKEKWVKVRNYFAVPYALFSTAQAPLGEKDYVAADGTLGNPDAIRQQWEAKDKVADGEGQAQAFVKSLKLDAPSEEAVLASLAQVYKAKGREAPKVFEQEFRQYAADTGVAFTVDLTQFTPRSHYTNTSLRRQYFRGMMWFGQVPFFLKSPALTSYAFAASQLLAERSQQLEDYSKLETAINFLVGTSDDLMPIDYLTALARAKDAPDQEKAVMETLAKMRDPKIKNLPAFYPTAGDKQTADVLLLTKGMRFFSQKFIIDSYWTGQLTQGDEAPKPGYTQKLPPMASSLEVMALLGSDYARSQIPTLDFYKPETKEAIDKAMADLTAETKTFDDAYWTQNVYNGWLWTIRSLFSWQDAKKSALPRFMQSPAWQAKTLQTAAGFWTELRHATLLYAKQSFAELGGGPPACDTRKVPEPPKGYIEPQVQAYDRLLFLARRTEAGLSEQGFQDLRNLRHLRSFIDVLTKVRDAAAKELANAMLSEKVKEVRGPDPYDETKICVSYALDGPSDWEFLRTEVLQGLEEALPETTDGPVLPAKDKRAAIVADVHTGGDSQNPTRVLYEATGVPYVIFVAVKDANGPRLTVGFTYAQHEFTEPYGDKRLTDEQWQKKFYTGDDAYDPFHYTPVSSWPAPNPWYAPLFVTPQ